ncbi:MAG: oligosaccharide flippase family protein [Bacteroidetes bacterium]|nr:oligosaccharide flippase family protein [Bacteroidota bacterium]
MIIENNLTYFKRLSSNFVILGIYQLANLIFPLLISPILISRLGIENFGLLSSAQALMTFFNIICDYGFNMSATQDISLHIDNSKKINTILNTVLCAKFLLLLGSFFVLIIVINLIYFFHSNFHLFLYSFLLTIGRAFFPIWFFQGIQKMGYLILHSFFSKISAALLILIYIKNKEDVCLVNPIIGVMDLFASIIIIYIAYAKDKFIFKVASRVQLKEQFRKGYFLFVSTFFSNISATCGLIILGLFVNKIDLGIYSVGEKIISVIKQIPVVVFQASYPQACRLSLDSKKKFNHFIKTIFTSILILMFSIGIIVFLLSNFIAFFFSRDNISAISQIVKVMCFLPLIAGLNIPSYIIILIRNKTKISSRIVIISAMSNIILSFMLCSRIGYWGTIIAIAIGDIFTTSAHIIISMKKYRLSEPSNNVKYA